MRMLSKCCRARARSCDKCKMPSIRNIKEHTRDVGLVVLECPPLNESRLRNRHFPISSHVGISSFRSVNQDTNKQSNYYENKNSVAFSLQVNYTD
jgi:hypothetical protein